MNKAEEDALVDRVMETEWSEQELRLAIRAAVAQERERCANCFVIAGKPENHDHYGLGYRDAVRHFAAKIRSGE